jgi:hypothetical protein
MTQTIEEYADGFWAWRVRNQPRSSDDILRVTRPPGWLPEVGHAAIAAHRAQRDTFEPALAELEARVHSSGTVAERVDVRPSAAIGCSRPDGVRHLPRAI